MAHSDRPFEVARGGRPSPTMARGGRGVVLTIAIGTLLSGLGCRGRVAAPPDWGSRNAPGQVGSGRPTRNRTVAPIFRASDPSTGIAPTATPLRTRLAGRVVDRRSGRPVAAATVRAERLSKRGRGPAVEIHSDSAGRFGFPGLPPGLYVVSAGRDNQAGFLDGPVALTADGDATEVTIGLQPAFAISGQVRDGNGRPLAGSRICVEYAADGHFSDDDPECIATSGGAGEFRIDGVLPGRFRVGAEAAGHGSARPIPVTVRDHDWPNLALTLERSATVHGQVLSREGRAVSNVSVAVEVRDAPAGGETGARRGYAQADAGEDGRFEIRDLGPGELRVTARHPELGRVEARARLGAGERREVRLRFAAPASVSGVVRRPDGKPAPGVTVLWMPTQRSGDRIMTKTAPDGSYRIEPLGRGEGIVALKVAGLGPLPGDDVRTGPIAVSDGQRRQGVDLVLP